MLVDNEIVEVEAADGVLQRLKGVGADIFFAWRRLPVVRIKGRLLTGREPVGRGVFLVQRAHQIEPGREQPFGQRFRRASFFQFRIGAKEFQILAIIKDAEELFVLAGAEQVKAQPGAASHHLPELCLRADLLEEDEIDHLRHIDARIQHIDGDGDMWRLRLFREVIDQSLGVGARLMGNDARELPCRRLFENRYMHRKNSCRSPGSNSPSRRPSQKARWRLGNRYCAAPGSFKCLP